MSEFIINANKIYIELNDNISSFEQEARVIDEAKCYLINYKELDNFEYDGAYTYQTSYGYCLCYNELVIKLEIEDGMITDCYFD